MSINTFEYTGNSGILACSYELSALLIFTSTSDWESSTKIRKQKS